MSLASCVGGCSTTLTHKQGDVLVLHLKIFVSSFKCKYSYLYLNECAGLRTRKRNCPCYGWFLNSQGLLALRMWDIQTSQKGKVDSSGLSIWVEVSALYFSLLPGHLFLPSRVTSHLSHEVHMPPKCLWGTCTWEFDKEFLLW